MAAGPGVPPGSLARPPRCRAVRYDRQDMLTLFGLADAPIWPSACKHKSARRRPPRTRNILAVNEYTADNDVTLCLGSGTAGQFIEVGVLNTEEGPVIIHAMEGRLRLFEL